MFHVVMYHFYSFFFLSRRKLKYFYCCVVSSLIRLHKFLSRFSYRLFSDVFYIWSSIYISSFQLGKDTNHSSIAHNFFYNSCCYIVQTIEIFLFSKNVFLSFHSQSTTYHVSLNRHMLSESVCMPVSLAL